jgi:hypothetical protein
MGKFYLIFCRNKLLSTNLNNNKGKDQKILITLMILYFEIFRYNLIILSRLKILKIQFIHLYININNNIHIYIFL